MKYWKSLFSIFTFCLFISNNYAMAESLIFIAEDAAPNSFLENGKATGKAVDIVRAIFKEIGKEEPSINVYPWTRGYKYLETKDNIALFPTSRTPKRESLFKWVGPLFNNEVNLYKLKSRHDITPKSLEDIKIYKVGSGGGINNMKTQFLLANGVNVEVVDHDKQNIEKLFLGRIDVIPYAKSRLFYDLNASGRDLSLIEKIWNIKEMSDQAYIALSKSTNDKLINELQTGLDSIKRKSVYKEIINKWK